MQASRSSLTKGVIRTLSRPVSSSAASHIGRAQLPLQTGGPAIPTPTTPSSTAPPARANFKATALPSARDTLGSVRMASSLAASDSGVEAPAPTCTTQAVVPGQPAVYSFFEDLTCTWQYIVADPATNKAVIIDSVLDFTPASGAITTQTADGLLAFVAAHNLEVVMILETHAHADHLTAAQYLKKRLGGDVPVGIGKRITQVQDRFAEVYGVPRERFEGAFDILWEDDQKFNIGELECSIVHLPGHTPDHVGYLCGKALFLGDTLFYPDVGSARADFPGGSASALYSSIERVLSLDADVKLYTGHDYPPQGAGLPAQRCWATVAEQREKNVHLTAQPGDNAAKAAPDLSCPNPTTAKDGPPDEGVMKKFIEWRAQRDRTLGAPRLLHPSLQVNICAGRLPEPDASGRRALTIPIKAPAGL